MLYILGGLPATGKTALSIFLAVTFGAMHVRIDTIEQALKDKGFNDLNDEGYQIAFGLALENLKNGISVVADSTNPVKESREAWLKVARLAQIPYVEIEIVCSDKREHRERVETRETDIPNLTLPDWKSVTQREYQVWCSPSIVLDTAGKTLEQSQQELLQRIREVTPST